MYSFYSTHTYGGQLPASSSRYTPSLPGKYSGGTVRVQEVIGTNTPPVTVGTVRLGKMIGNINTRSPVGTVGIQNNRGNVR